MNAPNAQSDEERLIRRRGGSSEGGAPPVKLTFFESNSRVSKSASVFTDFREIFVFQRSRCQKFVIDFGGRFFFSKKSVPKPEPKPTNNFGGLGSGPRRLANSVSGFGSDFGTDFFQKDLTPKSVTKFCYCLL